MRYASHLLLLFLTWLPIAFAQAADSTAAQIVSLQGLGEFREIVDKPWREAKLRQRVEEGSFVRTGDASRMGLMLADETQLRLAANSMIQVKQIGNNRDRSTVLRQSAGRSWMQSKNVPDKLTVETPTALAAIRGTDWELLVEADGTSILTVLSGEVILSNDQGSISIGIGEQGRAQLGQVPVKRILQNPRESVQWVSSFSIDLLRYPEIATPPPGVADIQQRALQGIGVKLRKGELAAARMEIERLAKESPENPTALLLSIDMLTMAGDTVQALTLLDAGAERFPSDARFDVWRSQLHVLRNEMDLAREALVRARKRASRHLEIELATGNLERLEGNAHAATAAYTRGTEIDPTSARAWLGLGTVHSEREYVLEAKRSLNLAIASGPELAGIHGELGALQTFADDFAAARRAFTLALDAHPDDYVALTGLALLELKSGNTTDAVKLLLAATLIEPRYARAHVFLGVAYYQQERTRDARFAFSRAREFDPKDPLPDLLESMLHNDQLHLGDALITARRAFSLLPYLRSLNQIANNQKGGANLGSALAAFGLEDWARNYAQDSYYPFWAGSHLFLADRYAGEFNKKSELFQGFLSDPTVFGTSNRFSDLIQRPGHHAMFGLRQNQSRDFSLSEATATVNGFTNADIPFAYFAEGIRTTTRPDQLNFDASADTVTLAFGVRPTYQLGIFGYANAFQADVALSPTTDVKQRIGGKNTRGDLGVHYRFAPNSQLWFKLGSGQESSTVNQTNSTMTVMGQAVQDSVFHTRPEQQDIQFRHTFAANERHELSWGGEFGRFDKTNDLVQDNVFHIGAGNGIPADRLTQRDHDHSRDIWLSDRFRINPTLLLQADLALQRYVKTRSIDIVRDREPPQSQSFPEDYRRSIVAPRLGVAYQMGNGATVRGALQRWLRPAAYNTLSPVATAGIPIDDTLVAAGGTLSRARLQFDWELSPLAFITAYADRRKVRNLNSPLDGVLNTRADVANLDRLRQHGVTNLAAADQLEATPVFSSGLANSTGITVNRVLTTDLAGYAGYVLTDAVNTGTLHSGKMLPYLPRQRALLGMTWSGAAHTLLRAQAVWRSRRFGDEANLMLLPAGWELSLKLHWESADKRWSLDAYAANLLKRDTPDLVGVQATLRF